MPTDITALTKHLTADLEASANPERARGMAQYLKTSMPFYAVTQLARKQLRSEALERYPINDIGSTDVVALLCVNQASHGGRSKIASTAAVHNAMLNEHPQLLELLFQSYHRSRLGEEEGGESQVYALPVFGLADGHFTSHYSRTYIEAAQLLPDVPKMSAQQWRALDVLAETAERLCMSMRLEPGDIQLLNNHVVFHSRSAFENDASRNLERVLLRAWLCMPDNRPLPVDHEVLWRNTDAGSMRGGIMPTSLG